MGTEIIGCFAVFKRLQQRAKQPAGRFIRRDKQPPLFEQRFQRGPGQAGFSGAIDGVPQAGAQFLGPLFAVFIGHCLGRGADLKADGKLAVTLKQPQAGAALGFGRAHHGRYFGFRQTEYPQNRHLAG